MQHILRSTHTRRAGGAAIAALALPLYAGRRTASAAPMAAGSLRAGAVYALTNASSGNAVASFSRSADGSLADAGMMATGGAGMGSGLGSQGALALSKDGGWLYAVNAGSNTISVLRVDTGLSLVMTRPSGGSRPISLTVSGNLLYVLNEASGTLSGFVVGPQGTLEPLANSTIPLPSTPTGTPPGPAQVSFTPDGNTIVVTEKAANAIVSYAVGDDGRLAPPTMIASSGATPFGFDFAGRTTLVVSEASGGASSYEVRRSGGVHAITHSLSDNQKAACWLVASENGQYAYVANAASGSISAYGVDQRGRLTLLTPDGVTASTGAGSHPTDEALTRGSGFLYVLLTPATSSSIQGFAVGADGTLQPAATVAGLPAGASGLAAW